MDIQGLTAIVTGATGRLGGAIAAGLAARGSVCVCHYHRNAEAAAALVERIAAGGGRALSVQADLSDLADIERIFETAKAFGTPRILINSASVFERRPLAELDAVSAQHTFAVNLTAPVLASRHFVEYLKNAGIYPAQTGLPIAKIINLTDAAAKKPWAEYAAYCASKAGLAGLTVALAKELAPAITVNAIAPGIVTWPEPISRDEEKKQLARIPAGRFGRPEEIVRSVLFLLDNDYITGQTLAVDGGRTI